MDNREVIFIVEPDPEGGYLARALGHSIVTHADSQDDIQTMVRDAVDCHFDPPEKPHIIILRHIYEEAILA